MTDEGIKDPKSSLNDQQSADLAAYIWSLTKYNLYSRCSGGNHCLVNRLGHGEQRVEADLEGSFATFSLYDGMKI